MILLWKVLVENNNAAEETVAKTYFLIRMSLCIPIK